MTLTVAMYSHDSVGLGHTRRNRAIAYALAAALPQPVQGILIAGHRHATAFDLPTGWDWLILPGFAHTGQGYGARHLGMGPEDLADMRARTIRATLEAIEPDLFIIDRHPFGVRGELLPALEMLRGTHCRTVLGLREVLDTPAVVAREWEAIGGGRRIADMIDTTWIYGDPQVHDPLATGEIPAELAAHAVHTGYLAPHQDPHGPVPASLPDKPCLLTTVGGGSDGGHLALAAARAQVPAGHRHLIVTGPQMPEREVTRLERSADPATTTVVRFLPGLHDLIGHTAGVICMGGYNSVAEVLATDTPALVVPRAARRAEQRIRARAVAAAGGVDTLDPGEVTPERLAGWMHGVVDKRVSREHLNLAGLATVGHIAGELLGVAQHV
ncbi:glycosyltransferase family protein [Corynebacterium sp.]|uniref:glycosyltransferase family protein n=1 Tax=Corynebacterium sp. TaxID=1720 RepID=UPI0026DF6A3C|nr:glycosyltransferase [Corynebacterium sp.]MDO5511427.1 glycosyltransferase [Corynebacterium sp.]